MQKSIYIWDTACQFVCEVAIKECLDDSILHFIVLYPKILAVSRHVHQFKDDVIELLKKCPFTVEVQDLSVSSLTRVTILDGEGLKYNSTGGQ